MADAAVRQLPRAHRPDRNPPLPDRHGRRAEGRLGPPHVLRAGDGDRPRAGAAGAHDDRPPLRPVPLADPDDAPPAVAAVAGRSARQAAPAPPGQPVPDPPDRRRRAARRHDRPRRDRVRPVPVPAGRERRQRQAHVRAEKRLRELRDRPEDRRGAHRAAARDLRAGDGRDGPAGRDAQQEDRRHPRDEADRLARSAARRDRAPAQDADGPHRRGVALARPGQPGAAQGCAGPAADRPQRAARRSAGAHGRGLARRSADRAGPQDGLPAGRSRRLSGRDRSAAQAQLCGGLAPARDAAADPRRAPRRRPRRSLAAPGPRRGGVQRRHEGRARARAGHRHRGCPARRLRAARRGRQQEDRGPDRRGSVRLVATAEHDRRARRVAGERRPRSALGGR